VLIFAGVSNSLSGNSSKVSITFSSAIIFFSFWKKVPKERCGEDAYVQMKLMEKYGGCGLIPSGAYHVELSTTLPDRKYNLPDVLY